MTFWLIIFAAALLAGVVAYIVSDTFRNVVQAIWRHWFKDSEVNFGSDIMSILGFIGMIVNDPSYSSLFAAMHISPTTLLAIGLIIRFLKACRNKGALPFTQAADK